MGNLKWVNSRLPRILQCFVNLMMLKTCLYGMKLFSVNDADINKSPALMTKEKQKETVADIREQGGKVPQVSWSRQILSKGEIKG